MTENPDWEFKSMYFVDPEKTTEGPQTSLGILRSAEA